jgi:Ca-activated chloride channel homolog
VSSHRKFACVFAVLPLASAFLWGVPASLRAQEKTDTAGQHRVDQISQKPTPPPSPKDEVRLQEGDVVRVETDLVNILFTAVDKDKRFVTTLRQEDIRVTEDGVPQDLFAFQRETDRPLSIVILIDVSASQQHTLPAEKAAARTFLNTVVRSGRDEVAVVSFTGDATLEQGLTGNAGRLQRAINRVEIVLPSGYAGGGVVIRGTPPIFGPDQLRAGSTAIWDAVFVTADEVLAETSAKTRRGIILVSDGIDTSSRLERSEAIQRAVKADTVIYSVGIGDSDNFEGVNKGSLRKLSERTGGRAFFPKDEKDLRAAFDQIQQELRSEYWIAYAPTNKNRDGTYRKVKIEVITPELRKQKLLLNYRQGYFARTNAALLQQP